MLFRADRARFSVSCGPQGVSLRPLCLAPSISARVIRAASSGAENEVPLQTAKAPE